MNEQKKVLEKIRLIIEPSIGTIFPGCVFGCATSSNKKQFAFGTQDGGTQEMKVSNVFDIASVTKAVLNVITLKLIPFDELDQKVVSVVPMKGRYRDQISVKHLITFGVEYGDSFKLSSFNDKEKMLSTILHTDLPFPPGISYRYTNISSMILTLFLEKKFKKTFKELVEEFCHEVGMNNTTFFPLQTVMPYEIIPTECTLARGILQDESARLYAQPTGSAGLFSTIEDLLSFGQSFLGDTTFLNKEIIKKMSISQFGNTVAMTFGLGMGLRHQNECDIVDANKQPVVVLKKNGFSGVHFCVLPENDFCFAIFGNICYQKRPTAEKRDSYTHFHKKLLSLLYEYKEVFV